MGCPSIVELGDNLTFSICTHDPDTGVLTDADAVPSWRVYEDETGAAIDNGDMAKLDDANTTGFYAETIACTTGAGFENGKTYTVYIEATVDGDTGGIAFGFNLLDKTGFGLAATGLDSITATTPAGVATTFPQKLVQLWNRFYGKATMTDALLTGYDEAGTSAATEQVLSDDNTTQTQNKATDA